MFVSVVGLGFVGLTLSLALVEKGVKVAGIEINPESYEKLSKGIPTINESGVEQYLKKNLGKNFQVFSKLEDLEEKPEFYVDDYKFFRDCTFGTHEANNLNLVPLDDKLLSEFEHFANQLGKSIDLYFKIVETISELFCR